MAREYSTLLLVAWYDGTRNKLGPDELRREFVLFCFLYRFLSNDATNYLSEDTRKVIGLLFTSGAVPLSNLLTSTICVLKMRSSINNGNESISKLVLFPQVSPQKNHHTTHQDQDGQQNQRSVT